MTSGSANSPSEIGLAHVASGKVRDVYEIDAEHLLVVASDRVSAFDVVMAEPIPDKGRVLTALTSFWLDRLGDVAPNHLVSVDVPDVVESRARRALGGRVMVVRKAQMLPVECIVRGYLAGSAWAEYAETSTVHQVALPAGLQRSSPLPEALFTPSTKADAGHDVNISFQEAARILGNQIASQAREICLTAYERAVKLGAEKGIIVADTKFELGFIDGKLSICDEVITPDSSRFWPADRWSPGTTPPSFDKQPLRDWLEATGWDKKPPPPRLPDHVVAATRARYVEAYERLSGLSFDDWPGVRQSHSEQGSPS
jgi:phosphoribosylaminoimidazole-succinocarboxamide synthase